jgi:phospholipase C
MQSMQRVCLAAVTFGGILLLAACQGLVAAGPSSVAVTLAGSGSGRVTSSPAGIDCGTACSADFTSGQSVTLTATPDTGFEFAGWSGTCSGSGSCAVPPGQAASVTATFTATLQSINHIVFMLQENRSLDHYFGKLGDYRVAQGLAADFDGLPANASNPSADGQSTVTAFHLQTMCVENPSPSWNESHVDFNLQNPVSATPTLDGFVWTAAHDAGPNNFHDVEGRRVMGYYTEADLPYYYFMATNFATSDRWFSPVMTRTQPNRMYLMAGTSAGHVYPLPQGTKVNNKTIFQLLEENGISWKIYVPDWGPNPVGHTEMVMFTFGDEHPENFVDATQFAVDAQNGTLPQVALIAAGSFSGRDEHPADDPNVPGGSVQYGSNYVANAFINPLMDSPSWKDSVFILTWDEGGGFYDHVAPQPTVAPDNIPPSDLFPGDICTNPNASGPTCGFAYTGYRVPLIVISPFAKKNYVSHTVADFTAILKFIQTRFNLPSLTARDAAQMDMTEFFDFENAPWKTPPSPPAQPSPGPCYLDRLP